MLTEGSDDPVLIILADDRGIGFFEATGSAEAGPEGLVGGMLTRAGGFHAGRLHQSIAAKAAEVYFIAAGLPLKMKG